MPSVQLSTPIPHVAQENRGNGTINEPRYAEDSNVRFIVVSLHGTQLKCTAGLLVSVGNFQLLLFSYYSRVLGPSSGASDLLKLSLSSRNEGACGPEFK
jgi:hypothetical protein